MRDEPAMWTAWIASAMLVLLGCAGGPTRDLARTAADLERDRPAPLSDDLPEATHAGLRMELDPLNAEIDRALATSETVPVLDILSLAVALEVSDPSCAFECERRLFLLYDGLALMYSNHFAFSASSAATEEAAMYDRMLARTPALARWAIGRVLSGTEDPAIVSLALQRLAGRERDERHLERARHYLEWALAIEPSVSRHAALGGICYRLGDLSCGDRELDALAGDPEAESIERLRDAARAAAAPATSIEALLDRAAALVILQQQDDAIALYERLAREHPHDARPHVGRAQIAFLDLASLRDPIGAGLRAGAHLDRAAHLSHREARYYELAMLVWGRRVLSAATQGILQASLEDLATRLDEIVIGFDPIDPATASAFDIYGRTLLRMVGETGAAGPSLAGALAARDRHPESGHLHRLSWLLAAAGDERPSAEDFGRFAGEDEVLVLAQVAAALRWRDPALLPGTLPDGEVGALALALRARHRLAPWSAVADRYRALLENADAASADRLRDGLAVALWWAGGRDAAHALFASLRGPAPELNRLAIADASARDTEWLERLQALRSGDDEGIACGAARVLQAADGDGDGDAPAECRSTGPADRGGTMSSGSSFDFEFILSSQTGFDSSLEVVLAPWLLVAPE